MHDTLHLTAFEHDEVPVTALAGDGVTPDEADYLSGFNEERPGFCERGFRRVRFANYCGVLTLGHRSIEVLPKVDKTRPFPERGRTLLQLLRQLDRFSMFQHADTGHALTAAPLLEVFVAAFVGHVATVVRSGLLRQYRERDEDLLVLRGRVVAGRQFGVLANRGDRVACCYDDFTIDNSWNRLLHYGLLTVRPWIRDDTLMRRWREVVAAFQDIGRRVPTERELDRLVFGRHETRYRAAVEWVRWIRRLQSPELRAGGSAAPGLLFDMNVLFQNAVARFIRSSMSSTRYDLREQDGGEALAILLSSPTKAFRLRPDILVRSPKGVAAIADTKWKLIRVGRGGYLMPEDSDVYQMHAYASAYRCLHVALVYPWHAGLTNSRETVFELPPTPGGRPRLSVMCLDVGDGGFVLKRGALRDVMPPEISRRVVR